MAAPAPVTPAELQAVDLLEDLDDAALAEWAAAAVPVEADRAGVIVRNTDGDEADLVLLLAGDLRMVRDEDGRPSIIGRQTAPTWIGAVSVLVGGPPPIFLQSMGAVRAAIVPNAAARRLVLAHASVMERVMAQVAPVIGNMTRRQVEQERLASLGTMAAGLAHELNNPAAAARRTATEMGEALEVLSSSLGRFVEGDVPLEDARQLIRLQAAALDGAEGRTALSALDAADAEDELTERLEDLGVPEAWRLAEPLAGAGVDAAWLDEVAAHAHGVLPEALGWVAASLSARTLAGELVAATTQLSSLVGSLKTYTYMDRGGALEVDLHEGLETTLVVLGHKLKHTGIVVRRDYDRTLPPVRVHGPELNQVWTNLLDNAIDVLGREGTITIETRNCEDGALVTIADDGPGMPRGARADLRRVLHDQGGRVGHGARPADGPPDRRRPPRGHHERRLRAGTHGLRGLAALRSHHLISERGPTTWPAAPTWTPSRSPSCPSTSPAARTACATGRSGCTCASASSAATSAAATTRRCATRARTTAPAGTRSSARSSRARTGRGASSTSSGCASRRSRGRRRSRRRRCSPEASGSVLRGVDRPSEEP